MTMIENELIEAPGIGHNLPPAPWLGLDDDGVVRLDFDGMRRFLAEDSAVAELVDRRKQLLDSASQCPQVIADHHTEKAASDLVKACAAAVKAAEASRVARKAPFL